MSGLELFIRVVLVLLTIYFSGVLVAGGWLFMDRSCNFHEDITFFDGTNTHKTLISMCLGSWVGVLAIVVIIMISVHDAFIEKHTNWLDKKAKRPKKFIDVDNEKTDNV